MFIPLIVGFILGFLGAIPVAGPISALVFSYGLKRQGSKAFALSVGAAVAESIYIMIAFQGYHLMKTEVPGFASISKTLTSLILISLGVYFVLSRPHLSADTAGHDARKRQKKGAFFLGFTVSILNPTLIATWTTAITAINRWSFFEFTVLNSSLFAAGAGFGIVAWFLLMLILIRKTRSRLREEWIRGLLIAFGLVLLLIGVTSFEMPDFSG